MHNFIHIIYHWLRLKAFFVVEEIRMIYVFRPENYFIYFFLIVGWNGLGIILQSS